MTSLAQRLRRWPNAPGIALRLVLPVLLLVPVGALTFQSWQAIDEKRAFAERERQGIEYLRALRQVTVALVDAQSAEVANRTADHESLDRAIEAAASVDNRLGDTLRSRERWAGVRAKIEALPERGLADPEEVYASYGEVTDLLLALHGKVRETSGMIRDPEADSYHLQDSAAEELPEALVAAGRLADLAVLATNRPAADRVRTLTELAAAQSTVFEPVEDLVEGLQAAINNTKSRRLSGNLLSRLSAYQQTVDALSAASLLSGTDDTPDSTRIATARTSAQIAAVELSKTMLDELDILIETRIDALGSDRLVTVLTGGIAILIILGLVALTLGGRRHSAVPAPHGHAPPSDGRRDLVEPGERRRGWPLPTDRSGPGPAGAGPGGPVPSLGGRNPSTAGRDPLTAGRTGEPTQWGRPDAAR
jgi:hypothetical protein